MLRLGADFVQVPAADIGEHPDQQDEEDEDEKDDETDRADAAAEGASPDSPQQAGEEGLDLWQAVHPFSPSRSGDLALSAGELVVVTKGGEADSWWQGYRYDDPEQEVGAFPFNYLEAVELLPDEEEGAGEEEDEPEPAESEAQQVAVSAATVGLGCDCRPGL